MNYLPRHRPQPQNMGPLYEALAKAQGEFPEIAKNKTGHGYKYADIADILRAVRPVLSRHGLAVFQNINGEKLETTLAHSSGACLSSSYPLVTDATGRMNNIQKIGAALTYARRYSLTALLGVAADEDIDAGEIDMRDRPKEDNTPGSGLRDAWVDGVLDKLPENATDRQRAVAFSEAIIEEMQSKKSPSGVNGVWNKREAVIGKLDKKHNDLFQSVFECFETCMASFEGAA